MTQPSTAVDPAAPLQLLVLGELARGGMARVDLARVLPHGEVVALKRLHRHLAADRRFVEMFTDEVWMTAALQHDNVVRLVAYGQDEEGMYLATELVHGAPLSLVASEGRAQGQVMPPELLAYVALQIARGLAAAHGLCDREGRPLGLVHRDVTPSNVLVAFDGAVKLTDFGVARAAGRTSHTATGVLKGKVAFMSPEYARHRQIDGRSDLYSVGVTLFVVASGRLPFDSEHDLELLRSVVEDQAPSLGELVPGFDGQLGELIARLLRKSPEERPSSAVELAGELEAWLAARGRKEAELRVELGAYATRHAGSRERHLHALVARAEERGHRGTEDDGEPDTITLTVRLDTVRAAEPAQAVQAAQPTPRRREEPRATRVVAAPALATPPVVTDNAPSITTETAADATRLPWAFALAAGALVLLVGGSALWLQHGEPTAGPRLVPGLEAAASGLRRAAAEVARPAPTTELAPSTTAATAEPAASLSAEPAASATTSASVTPPLRLPPRPPPRPRSCTPADFDYPSCLSR